MRKLSCVVAVVALLAGSARAADVTPGFGASLRLAYGLPAGNASGGSGQELSKVFSGSLPIQLDLGYRFTPNISAAVFGQYAFGFIANDVCPAGVSCSGHVIRAGLEGFFHLMPGNSLDPWVGVGVGYEWAKFSAEQSGVSGDTTFKGFEFVNLQLGADWLVAPSFGVGPFVQVTFGQYSSADVSLPGGGGGSGDITDKSLHEWIQFGIRGTYNL